MTHDSDGYNMIYSVITKSSILPINYWSALRTLYTAGFNIKKF